MSVTGQRKARKRRAIFFPERTENRSFRAFRIFVFSGGVMILFEYPAGDSSVFPRSVVEEWEHLAEAH